MSADLTRAFYCWGHTYGGESKCAEQCEKCTLHYNQSKQDNPHYGNKTSIVPERVEEAKQQPDKEKGLTEKDKQALLEAYEEENKPDKQELKIGMKTRFGIITEIKEDSVCVGKNLKGIDLWYKKSSIIEKGMEQPDKQGWKEIEKMTWVEFVDWLVDNEIAVYLSQGGLVRHIERKYIAPLQQSNEAKDKQISGLKKDMDMALMREEALEKEMRKSLRDVYEQLRGSEQKNEALQKEVEELNEKILIEKMMVTRWETSYQQLQKEVDELKKENEEDQNRFFEINEQLQGKIKIDNEIFEKVRKERDELKAENEQLKERVEYLTNENFYTNKYGDILRKLKK